MYWTSWKPNIDSFNGLGATWFPTADNPIWWAPLNYSSVSNLPQDLTINGITVSPSFRYEGKNATTSGWTATVGPNLTIASTGTDPLVGRDTPLIESADKAVRVMGGTVWDCSNNSAHQVTTEDLVFEIFGAFGTTGGVQNLMGTYGSSGVGWRLYTNLTQIILQLVISTNTNMIINLDAAESWQHLMFFVDRNDGTSNGCRWYKNGVLNNTAIPSASTGDISNSNPFVIGATAVYGSKVSDTSDIAYCAMYKRSNWFAGGAQNSTDWELVARTRCAQIAGIMPRYYTGTEPPTIKTRTTAGFLDKVNTDTGVRRLFYMGSGWPRICKRTNYSETTAGLLTEGGKTDLLSYSSWPNNATYWTHTNIAAPTVDGVDLPWPTATVYANDISSSVNIIPDGYLGQHGISRTTTSNLSATFYMVSVFAKAVSKNWLRIYNSTAAVGATYNLSSGTTGTITGSCTPGIEPWGNGWYRCWLWFTGTVATHTFVFNSATDTTDSAYSGDGYAIGTKVWKPQVVLGVANSLGSAIYPTTPIINTSTSTTLGADRIEFTTAQPTFPVGMEAVIQPAQNAVAMGSSTNAWTYYNWSAASGTTGNAAIRNHIWATDGKANINVYAPTTTVQANFAGTSSILDGYTSLITGNFDTNNVRLKVDRIEEGTPDASATMPSALQYLQVGMQGTGANCADNNFLLSDLKIWNKFR